jgi:hypothetical protein
MTTFSAGTIACPSEIVETPTPIEEELARVKTSHQVFRRTPPSASQWTVAPVSPARRRRTTMILTMKDADDLDFVGASGRG